VIRRDFRPDEGTTMKDSAAGGVAPPLQAEDAAVILELGFAEPLTALRDAIEAWVAGCDPEMREALDWQFLGRSKYFRPLTLFACHEAVARRPPDPAAIRSALIIELIHNTSLVIDDILDRSPERRGKPTMHCRFGELRALMASGYIVAEAYRLAQNDAQAVRLISELLQRLGVAECLQWRLRQQPLGLEDWRRIASEDTGSMFEVAACFGDRSERLRRYGNLLGTVYHGCDDVGDVKGLEALGGGGQEDLRDGILTLPAAIAIRDPETRARFQRGGDDDLPHLAIAFRAALPAAERELDRIAEEARAEAERHAADPKPLVALVRQTRGLSAR
jgi:geranylgeranyl pyrophosphate synthase